jgi:chromosome segregation ATPase
VPRLRDARSAFAEVSANATALGEGAAPELAVIGRRIDELGEQVASDPISANSAEFDSLEAELLALRTGWEAARGLREDILERLDRARSTMDEIRRATSAAAEAHAEVIVKIADPGTAAPEAVDRTLAEELDEVIASSDQGNWRATHHALETWTARAEQALAATHECARANRAPIEARNELRGRLDAYNAMAHDIGMLEDAAAHERYERARNVLYTAPTDLTRASELVRDYQDALSVQQSDRKEPR